MIREDEVYKIGRLTKPHGVSGELCMVFTDDVFDRVEADYLLCRMDGILVPFFIEEYRFSGDDVVLMKLGDVDNEEQARRMAGVDVFFPKALACETKDGINSWAYFTGFDVVDVNSGRIGTVRAVNDATMNVLFEVERPQGEMVLLPAVEELIDDIDHKQRKIFMTVPEGLLALDEQD